jgi:putative aminopeptidase FrvX
VVLTVDSGEPRRLAACALGEPGLIVSSIREDGYLQVVPDGSRPLGALWTQSFEGQTVVIGGAKGWRAGGRPEDTSSRINAKRAPANGDHRPALRGRMSSWATLYFL